MPETQEMLDFAALHGIGADVEVMPIERARGVPAQVRGPARLGQGASGVRFVTIAAYAREQHPRQHHDQDHAAHQQLRFRHAQGTAARGSNGYRFHKTPPRLDGISSHTRLPSHRAGTR